MFTVVAFSGLLFFGALAIVFSFLWERNRHRLREVERELGRQLYELTILREVGDKIGYSLKTRDIARTIALTAEAMFPLQTASYAVVEDGQIIVEHYVREGTPGNYLTQVGSIVMNAITGIDNTLTHIPVRVEPIQHMAKGSDAVRNNNTQFDAPKSFFNIPLVLNNRFVGIISITSPEEKVYQDKDMSMLYKIVNQTQVAIGRLENTIETEKGKIQSLIYSLSSGALLFLNDAETDQLKLTTLNNAARSFLRLTGPLDTAIVFSQFRIEGNIVQEVRGAMQEKALRVLRGIELYDKRFNLYITPVFDNATMRVIGVSITMQDVTIEYQAEKLRENFTNMVVHELRAPLSSIKGSAELLQKGTLSDEERVRMLTTMVASSDRMLHDVNQLLDAAKIQAGKFEISVAPGNLGDLIEERVKMFTVTAEKRHIRVFMEKDGDLPIFNFDMLRIGQILNNLLSNAVKYNRDGGEVVVRVGVVGGRVRLTVSDTGMGIPESLQAALFTKFYQTSSAHRGSGTGLGLYITKAIVTAHGGTVAVDSEEGKGTTVTIELPMVGAHAVSREYARPYLPN